jgi:hypothetical protein
MKHSKKEVKRLRSERDELKRAQRDSEDDDGSS